MEIGLVSIISNKQEWSELAAATYTEKINHNVKFMAINLKSKKLERDDSAKKKELESKAIIQSLKPEDYVILCDELGKEFSSLEFSKKLFSIFESGKRRAVFVVGGAFGVDGSVKRRADLTLKLSTLTMNHLVARIQILEQIYRATMIWKGRPYHNE